jgi:hypothetical protein
VDIVSSFILGIPFAIYVIAKIYSAHLPPEKIGSAVSAAMSENTAIYFGQLFVGMCCSVLGGYVAARLARHDELLNGALAAFLCVCLGIYAIASGKDTHHLYIQILLLVSSPALGLLGGYLRFIQKRPSIQAA